MSGASRALARHRPHPDGFDPAMLDLRRAARLSAGAGLLPLREIVALVAAIAAARHRWETWEKWEPFRPVDFPDSPISRKIISRARVGWPKGFPCFPGFPRPGPPIPRKPAEISHS